MAQCVEVFIVRKNDQGTLFFYPGLSLYQTHQHEWQCVPKSKPVSVDDSLAKNGIPRAKCQI